MLALAEVRRQEEADRCHMCGLPTEVCRAKATEKEVTVEFERCHVTTALLREREKQEQDNLPHIQGVDFIPMMPDPMAGLLPAPDQPDEQA